MQPQYAQPAVVAGAPVAVAQPQVMMVQQQKPKRMCLICKQQTEQTMGMVCDEPKLSYKMQGLILCLIPTGITALIGCYCCFCRPDPMPMSKPVCSICAIEYGKDSAEPPCI